MSRLFRLPLEIRQKVYEECLVVGKVFPYSLEDEYDDYWRDYGDDRTARKFAGYEAPAVSLLLACKAIHAEAEQLLYQRNTFVLPALHLTARFFQRTLRNDTRKSWINSVELAFGTSDLNREERVVTLDEELDLARDDMLFPEKEEYSLPGVDDWTRHMHLSYRKRLISVAWPRKACFILENLQLRNLTVNYTSARCIEDCCCLTGYAAYTMKPGFALRMPQKLDLIGLGAATEAVGKKVALWTEIRGSSSSGDDGSHYEERMSGHQWLIDSEMAGSWQMP